MSLSRLVRRWEASALFAAGLLGGYGFVTDKLFDDPVPAAVHYAIAGITLGAAVCSLVGKAAYRSLESYVVRINEERKKYLEEKCGFGELLALPHGEYQKGEVPLGSLPPLETEYIELLRQESLDSDADTESYKRAGRMPFEDIQPTAATKPAEPETDEHYQERLETEVRAAATRLHQRYRKEYGRPFRLGRKSEQEGHAYFNKRKYGPGGKDNKRDKGNRPPGGWFV